MLGLKSRSAGRLMLWLRPFLTGVVSRRSRRRIGGDVALDGGTRNVDLVGKLAIKKKKGTEVAVPYVSILEEP